MVIGQKELTEKLQDKNIDEIIITTETSITKAKYRIESGTDWIEFRIQEFPSCCGALLLHGYSASSYEDNTPALLLDEFMKAFLPLMKEGAIVNIDNEEDEVLYSDKWKRFDTFLNPKHGTELKVLQLTKGAYDD